MIKDFLDQGIWITSCFFEYCKLENLNKKGLLFPRKILFIIERVKHGVCRALCKRAVTHPQVGQANTMFSPYDGGETLTEIWLVKIRTLSTNQILAKVFFTIIRVQHNVIWADLRGFLSLSFIWPGKQYIFTLTWWRNRLLKSDWWRRKGYQRVRFQQGFLYYRTEKPMVFVGSICGYVRDLLRMARQAPCFTRWVVKKIFCGKGRPHLFRFSSHNIQKAVSRFGFLDLENLWSNFINYRYCRQLAFS